MNINIDDDTYPRVGVAIPSSRNLLLQKIFKFTTIFVGVILSILITVDIGDKFFKSYNQDSLRILSLAQSNREEQNKSDISKISNNFIPEVLNNTFDAGGVSLKDFQNLIEQEKELLVNFYNKVDRQTYRGTWKSEEKFKYLSDRSEGEIAFRIEKIKSYSSLEFDKVFIVFRLLDGHFIDKWLLVRSFNRPYWNLTIGNNSIEQHLNSFMDYGEIFEKIDYERGEDSDSQPEVSENSENSENSIKSTSANSSSSSSSSELNQYSMSSLNNCRSIIKLDWNNNTLNSSNLTNLIGSFSSSCGFNNFTFNLELEKEDEDYPKVMLYSVIVTFLALSQIFNTIWITLKINDSQTFANSISLITVLQNIVWNAYGCLCHFFLTVNYDYYTLQFGVPAFLYFANFSIFEIKLLYSIWRIKNMRYANDQAILRKKLIQFYFMFYVIMFFSLFYVMKFFFEKKYIFTAIIFTWIPQIIFNAVYKNRLSMPLMNIILIGVNKIFLPFYFRGCPENFFQLSYDYKFISLCLVCLILETLIMYSQTTFNPRWFLPKKFNESTFNFYKTKSEVLLIRPDAEFHDCVICLFSLLSSENYRHFSDDFVAAGEENRINKKYCSYYENLKFLLLNFHETSLNINRKPYMMTPCKHFFHTPCLESWFKQKKECPSCRQDIDESAIGLAI